MKHSLLFTGGAALLGSAFAVAQSPSQPSASPWMITSDPGTSPPYETEVPYEGPPEAPGGPSWYIQGSPADPLGPIPLANLTAKGELGSSAYARRALGENFGRGGGQWTPTGYGTGRGGGAGRGAAGGGRGRAGGGGAGGGGCQKSPLCIFDGTQYGGVNDTIERVKWRENLGFKFAYPITLPAGGGNVGAVSVDSKDNIWVYQRNNPTMSQLYKYSPDFKLLVSVDPQVTNHGAGSSQAHGMKVDDEDNVWTCDGGGLVQKFDNNGRLIFTLGERGKPGDWDESKGQRLIWECVAIDFGPNGDAYIFQGHADESPNDIGTAPHNTFGLARVTRVTKDGTFISQWFGSDNGQGKFSMTHGGAVDPTNGDVWIGDRQQYRAVVFNASGHFLRTISMRNLTSAFFFDRRKGSPTFGQLWLAAGQDGQVLRLDKATGKVTGAIGTRKSTAPGYFSEAAYMGLNSKGHFYVGDSQVNRVTELIPPKPW
jgi:hypothetical protein